MPRSFEYMGFKILVDRNVYDPSTDSFLMAEAILNHSNVSQAVELGAGCGLLSLIATRVADRVFSYDTCVYSYRNTLKNVVLNGLKDKIQVFLGDGRDAPTADLVIINPPYLPSDPLYKQDVLSCAWNGGPDGLRVILNMLEIARRIARSGGSVLIVRSSLQNSLFFYALKNKGFKWSLVKSKLGFYERIEIYKCIKL
ncbi:MAG: methyltransferase [Thermoprotei archaeon]